MKKDNISKNKTAVKWLVRSVDPKTLLAFFKNKSNGEPVNIGSFRMILESFSKPAVLVSLTNDLQKDKKRFNLFLREESMPWNPYVELIKALDEDWIIEHITELFEVLAERYLLVALAADTRPRVDKLAIAFWEDSNIWTAKLNPKTEGNLLTLFKPFFSNSTTEKPVVDTELNTSEMNKLKKRVETEKKKNHDLIADRKAEVKKYELKLQLLKDEHKINLKAEKEQVQNLEQQIASLTKESDDRIVQAVNRYKQDVLNFSTQEEEEKLDRNTFSMVDQLLSKVDLQLDIHAAHNKKHGTYSRIRQQIVNLEKALTKTSHCLSESLLADNELVTLKNDLQQQIQTLKSLPKIRESFNTEVDKYKDLIDQLPLVHGSLSRLADLTVIFKNPEITLLFGAKPDGLEKMITDKKNRIETILAEKSMASRTSSSLKNDYIVNVKSMLSENNQPVYCFIDACNVTLSHSFRNGFDDESSLSERRKQLKQDCLKVASNWEQIVIAYDCQFTTGNIKNDKNIETVFVDKLTDDQNADNYIIRRLKVLHQHQIEPSQICVVTADRDLQIRSKQYCENIIRPENFLQYLLN